MIRTDRLQIAQSLICTDMNWYAECTRQLQTLNCGYARVAMQEQTESYFKKFFQVPLNISNKYFETKQGGKTRSQLKTHSKAIKAMFCKKMAPTE